MSEEFIQPPHEVAAEMPNKSHRQKSWRVALWIGVAAAVVIFIAGVFIFMHRNTDPLPAALEKNAGFPLYYPSPVPAGYSYRKGSGKLNGNIVFYEMQSGNDVLSVSEQPTPPNPPDLAHLAGFTSLQTPAGNTAIGMTLGQPIAIILSNTTLITITGHKNVPSDVVSNFAKSMISLPQ